MYLCNGGGFCKTIIPFHNGRVLSNQVGKAIRIYKLSFLKVVSAFCATAIGRIKIFN